LEIKQSGGRKDIIQTVCYICLKHVLKSTIKKKASFLTLKERDRETKKETERGEELAGVAWTHIDKRPR
jgi:hypothetical protein